MRSKSKLVSIITPSYNCSAYIEDTIQCILRQTYNNWELLITDDCSTDNSIEIISKYTREDKRIKLFVLSKNSGAGVARNNSIKHAKGRFIAFCDSDDIWLKDKLEKQISFMLNGNYAFTYTDYYHRVEGEETAKIARFPKRMSHHSFLKDSIGCLTAIYDTAQIGKIYMPTIRKRQDWALWHLIIKKTKYAYGIQEPLAVYNVRCNSISSNKLGLVKHNLRVYREVLGFSYLKSILTFAFLFMPKYISKKIRISRQKPQNII